MNLTSRNQDQLYLIKHDFVEGRKTYYCPGCAELLGLLEIYPTLKRNIAIHYVEFVRPRPALVSLLGEAHQSCPVLVLAQEPPNLPEHLAVLFASGHAFVEGPREIGHYLAHVHGIGIPHEPKFLKLGWEGA